jgi:hypothetical protein
LKPCISSILPDNQWPHKFLDANIIFACPIWQATGGIMPQAHCAAAHRLASGLVPGLLPGLVVAVLSVGLAQPVLAGDQAASTLPAPAPAKDGEIIYARDVGHAIGDPHFPGRSHATVTAPTGAITGTIALGLAPLTDSETSRVTSSLPLTAPLAAMSDFAPLGGGAQPSQTGALVASETASLSGGSAIGQAMGALSGALGSLSAITGGRP